MISSPLEAEDLLGALPEDERQAPQVLAERGQIALGRRNWATAETLLRQALSDLPRDGELLHALQQALARQGKSAESDEVGRTRKQAEEDTRRMSELMKKLGPDPTNAELRFECAEIFLRNDMTEDAIRWLKMTLELKPEHQQAREKLAICYQKQGAKDRAAR